MGRLDSLELTDCPEQQDPRDQPGPRETPDRLVTLGPLDG